MRDLLCDEKWPALMENLGKDHLNGSIIGMWNSGTSAIGFQRADSREIQFRADGILLIGWPERLYGVCIPLRPRKE